MRIPRTYTLDEEIVKKLDNIPSNKSNIINTLLHNYFAEGNNASLAEVEKLIAEKIVERDKINSQIDALRAKQTQIKEADEKGYTILEWENK